MENIKTLTSNIGIAGTKFIVTEESKDNIVGPGTMGVISHVRGRDEDYHSVAHLSVVITRRGKTGKARLDLQTISTPVFNVEAEDIEKVLPDAKRKYFVYLELQKVGPGDILTLSPIDYLAWAEASVKYNRMLCDRANKYNPWPNSSDNILNRLLNVGNDFEHNQDMVIDKYCDTDSRKHFISKIRLMENTLIRCALIYMRNVARIEETAIRAVIDNCHKLQENKVVENTLGAAITKRKAIEKLQDNR